MASKTFRTNVYAVPNKHTGGFDLLTTQSSPDHMHPWGWVPIVVGHEFTVEVPDDSSIRATMAQALREKKDKSVQEMDAQIAAAEAA